MTVEALDLGDAMRASAAQAGLSLDSDAPLVSGPAPAARAESDNPFQKMLDNGGELPAEPSPAPAEPEPEPTPPPSGALSRLKEQFNVDLTSKYKDDDDLLQAHVNLTKKLAERDEYANLGRVAVSDPQKLISRYRELGYLPEPQQQQPKQPEPTPQPTSDLPEWEDEFNNYIERGRLIQDTPPAIAKRINEYYSARNVAKSPQYQKLNQELAAIKEQLARQQPQPQQPVDPRLDEYIQAQQAEKLIERNANWLFKDGKTHQSGFTPDGFVWVQALQDAATKTNDPALAIKLADQEVALRKLSSTTPPPTPNKQATHRAADPARPAQPQELLSGDIIRPGEDIAAAARRLLKQAKYDGSQYW